MNQYVKNYFLSIANTVMMLLFPLISFPYISRILGPSNLGIINFAISYGYYFIHIASFGLNSYAIREVSKVRNDKRQVETTCNELFNLNLFFSIFSTILYFVGVFLVPNFRGNLLIFSFYSVTILSNFLALDWLLQSFEDYLFSTVRNALICLLSLIAIFLLVKNDNDLAIYMLITCIAEIGTKISTLLYCRKKYAKLIIRKKFLNFKKHLKSMFTLFSFRFVNGLSANLDKLMIGFMMVYASVGVYSAGVKFVLILIPIVETVGIVLFPKINISANKSHDEYIKNLRINYNLILLMGIPMSVGMFLISERLIPLFAGEQYIDAINVSRIMAIVIILCPIGDMLGSKTLLVFKKDKWLLYCSSLVAVSNIVLNVLFIQNWGINGAAAASVLSYVVAVLSRYYFTRKIVKINLLSWEALKYSLFTIPFTIIYIIFRDNIDNNTIWAFGFIIFCMIVYTIELLATKDYLATMLLNKFFRDNKKSVC